MTKLVRVGIAAAVAGMLGVAAVAFHPGNAAADECWWEDSDWNGSGPKTCLGTDCPAGGGSSGFCCYICRA